MSITAKAERSGEGRSASVSVVDAARRRRRCPLGTASEDALERFIHLASSSGVPFWRPSRASSAFQCRPRLED